MISTDVMIENEKEFIELIKSITREGLKVDELLNYLETSDFFIAPSSTKYHGAYPGGLCEHSLDVYKNLKMLLDNHPQYFYEDDTVKIVSLLHDISKTNLYKKDIRNKKVYHESGSKTDNLGRYDWVSEEVYSIDYDHRLIYGNHEQTSEFMVRLFTPLSMEESIALLHHHGGMGWDSTQINITDIYKNYPLALFLHIADLIGAYINQNE